MTESKLLENLNNEQLQAVKHAAGPLLIVAGAGTGKTTVITKRIAYLIEQKLAKPEEILALTFTDKAAGEMQERVDLLLPLGYHEMWISTFHSFCQRILEQFGLDIGLPGDFKLLNETRGWVLVHNNLEKFDLNYYRPLGNPKKFISALLKHFSRCKDELITPERYLGYAEELKLANDNPDRVERVGNRGQEKIKNKEGAPPLHPEPSTLNPLEDPSEILRITEIANAFHVYQKLLLDNNYLDFADLINYTIKLFTDRPQILKRLQGQFKYIMVDEFQDTNYAQYQLVKMLAGSSGVMLRSAADLSAEALAKEDEASRQSVGDSSPSDALGLRMTPKEDRHQNLVVVGDDDQSIYKFRGASVSNILKFKDDYPKLRQITLTENYRSAQEILDLAYNFIQSNNPDRLEVKLNIDKRLKSSAGNGLKPSPGATIEVIEGKDLSEELNAIAKKINELKSAAPTATWNDFAVLLRSNAAALELLPILAQHNIPHTFVANTGLYSKPMISDLIAYLQLLNNFHDSFALYRVLSFPAFAVPAKDLATLLAGSERKTLSLYEMLQGAKALPNIGQRSQKTFDEVLALLHRHAKLAGEKSANELFVEVVRDLKLESRLGEETLENAENRELLEQFYKKIENFVAENSDKSLHHFLHLLQLELEAGDEGQIKFDPNLGPESLKVLTVHAAKGLEFEYVFIPNLVDQRFPTRARGESIEIPRPLIKDILPEGDFHLQEERRLFYVALTRAKSHLYLSWGRDYGGAKTKKPSIFLQETKLVPGPVTSLPTGKVVFTTAAKRPQVYQTLPESFSFSAIKAFQTCPLQYKYQYYLRLPAPGSPYFSFGQTIHRVFELYLKDFQSRQNRSQQDLFAKKAATAELGSLADLQKLYEQNWIDEWYENKKQKEDYRQKGRQLLQIFYDHLRQNPPRPKYLEKSFRLPLGAYKFTGKIDRADAIDGSLAIIDYKTSEKIPKKNDKDGLDQLLVYQWAAQEYLGEKVTDLCYWYLSDNKFLREPTAGQAGIDELKQRLLQTIGQIIDAVKHDRFAELHRDAKDHRCDFADLL